MAAENRMRKLPVSYITKFGKNTVHGFIYFRALRNRTDTLQLSCFTIAQTLSIGTDTHVEEPTEID